MNDQELEKYFSLRIKQLGMIGALTQPGEVTDLVREAIRQGKADLWHRKPWDFRRKQYSLSVTSAADRYELPQDFSRMLMGREEDSLYGLGFIYVSKDEFDRRVPKPSAHDGGEPMLYTVYRDYNGKHYIQFYPRPSSMTIYLSYLMDTPQDTTSIPDIARAALFATIGKYLYAPGTTEFMTAVQEADREIRSLESQDSFNAEEMWKFYDDTDLTIEDKRPWL